MRADASVALEIVAEEGGTGEVVLVGEVGQGDVGLQEVEAYLHDGVDVDGLFWGLPVMALHDVGQVAWCDAKFVGVEIDAARGAVALCQQLAEAEEQLVGTALEIVYLYIVFPKHHLIERVERPQLHDADVIR